MATATPVEIGTRGTVASLLLREIEHFSKLELGGNEKGMKKSQSQSQVSDIAPGGDGGRSKFWFGNVTPKKRKKIRRSGFLPRVCSNMDVVETKSRLNYRNLKADVRKLKC
ncbi:hypothetical protein ACHQM5_003642 [Ranunculus cassubicifolius]